MISDTDGDLARDFAVETRESTSDDLPRSKEGLPTPSTPLTHRPARSDISPSVRRRLFSSPAVPLDFPDENRPAGCVGLGFTGSPSAERSRTHDQKRTVADKSAEAKVLLPAIDTMVDSSNATGKDEQMKKGKQSRTRKQTRERVQWRNRRRKMNKMGMRAEMKERNNQPLIESLHWSDSQSLTATSQLRDESPSQVVVSSLPLARDFPKNPTAMAETAPVPNKPDTHFDTDSDSTSNSDTDVLAELFPQVKPETSKPVVPADRGWVPPYGGNHNHPDYFAACVRQGEKLGLPGWQFVRKKTVGKKFAAKTSAK